MTRQDVTARIFIVIPVYGRLEYTKRFLSSTNDAFPEEYDVVFIIVDDSPENEHGSLLSTNINIVKGTGDLYWGGGINRGVEFLERNYPPVESDLVAFANNDVTLTKDLIANLLVSVAGKERWLIHPMLRDQDENYLSPGSQLKLWLPFITRRILSVGEGLVRADFLSARFMLMNRSVLHELGGVTPTLPHYGGDNEFSYRAKKLGIGVFVDTDHVISVDERATGLKVSSVRSFGNFIRSFYSIKSPHCIKYRYVFCRSFFGPIASSIITVGMFFKSMIQFMVRR